MLHRDELEQALGNALGSAQAPAPGDAEMLRRLVGRVTEMPLPGAPRGIHLPLGPSAGAGLAVGIAVLAALMAHRAPSSAVTVTAPTMALVVAAAPPSAAQAVAPIERPSVAESPQQATPLPMRAEVTAAQLFVQANDARRKGHDAEAMATYRTLQRRFSSSPEAVASHMSLGRLLLDGRHDAAGALVEFDRYLASASRGELREEALIGRALALGQLERSEEERRAWQALLREYPSSMYADQARDRIATLGG